MKTNYIYLLLSLKLLFSGCNILQDVPHDELDRGEYEILDSDKQSGKIYADWSNDTLLLYFLKNLTGNEKKQVLTDTLIFPDRIVFNDYNSVKLVKTSFDLDFITILFKYRPGQENLPRQLNSDLSGGIFMGYRRDIFNLDYEKSPLELFNREIMHFGYSFGIFTGIGATAMNPWVTNNNIADEYEGVVWMNGLAGIVGVGQFTLGLTIGWDYLLDHNRNFWLYQNKPWLGLSVGINLN